MDPASIFAVVEGAGGLVLKCVGVAKSLNDIASKYKHSRLTVLSIVQHLEIVQLAWERIDKWSQKYSQDGTGAPCEEDEKLFKRLQTSLNVGYMVMEALEDDLLPFHGQSDNLALREKARIIWNESALNAHQDRLGHQVQAMTCLLQTIQLELPENRRDFLEISEPILFKSDESAYSIVPSRRSSKVSLSTTHSTGSISLQYYPLAFEDTLFTARVYKRNYRNYVIDQLFKARTDQSRSGATLEHEKNVASGSGAASSLPHPLNSVVSYLLTSIDHSFTDACQRNATRTLKQLTLSGRWTPESQKVSFDFFRRIFAEAVVSDRFEVARALLFVGADTCVSTMMEEDGLFLIERACVKPKADFLKLLLERAAKCSDPVGRFDLNGQLLKVASTNTCEMMVMLIKAGADVNCASKQGCRPLHLVALRSGSEKCIQKLLENGADIDAQNNEGMTPLVCACSQSRLSNARFLIACGANFAMSDKTASKLLTNSESLDLNILKLQCGSSPA